MNFFIFEGFHPHAQRRIFLSFDFLSGLRLVLFIEDYFYLPGISENKGAVVSIHPFKTMSFPEINGLGLRPGETTFIAIRQVINYFAENIVLSICGGLMSQNS